MGNRDPSTLLGELTVILGSSVVLLGKIRDGIPYDSRTSLLDIDLGEILMVANKWICMRMCHSIWGKLEAT